MTSALLTSCDGGDPSTTSSQASASTNRLRDSDINTADTYLTATVSIEFDATVQSPRPIYDAATGTSSTTLVLDGTPTRYSVEAGYDANGAFVFNQLALEAPGNPYVQSVDLVRLTRVYEGRFEFFDVNGYPMYGTEDSDGPTLESVLDASPSEILQILDEMIVSRAPQTGTTTSPDGSTVTVSGVSESGDLLTVQTQVTSSGAPTLPQRRLYRKTATQNADVSRGRLSQAYALTEVRTDIAATTNGTQVTGTATMRIENLQWSRNATRDQMRHDGTAGSAFGSQQQNLGPPRAPRACDTYDEDCTLEPPTPTSNPTGTPANPSPTPTPGCGLVPGGANLIYVQGIRSNGAAWGSPTSNGMVRGRMRCGLTIGADIAPDLSDGDHHSVQANELRAATNATARRQHIFIAHSQGGLISRRVAQTFSAEQIAAGDADRKVRAVVTIGTPHLGANIARNIPTNVADAAENIFTHTIICRIVPTCLPINRNIVAVREGLLTAVVGSQAQGSLQDLTPNSSALQLTNGVDEGPLFPRYGIQHYVPKRWAFFRVIGDASSARDGGGPAVADAAGRVFAASVGGSAISFFSGRWRTAAFLAWVAYELDKTDRWWTRITAGSDRTDGVVEGTSQVYPGAILNFEALNPTSHTGEIDTYKSYVEIEKVLRERLSVTPRQ